MNDTRTDHQLLDATREGDLSAYASLFRRHYRLGRRIAASVAAAQDVDDVVQETFASIYEAISRGAGPRLEFIPYFRTALRNTAIVFTTRGRREIPVEDIEHALVARDQLAGAYGGSVEYLSASKRAFASLPERWQRVLYYTVVEGMKPSQAAPLLGVTTTAATQLAYRARQGLRHAWVAATSETSAERRLKHAQTRAPALASGRTLGS